MYTYYAFTLFAVTICHSLVCMEPPQDPTPLKMERGDVLQTSLPSSDIQRQSHSWTSRLLCCCLVTAWVGTEIGGETCKNCCTSSLECCIYGMHRLQRKKPQKDD